MVWQMSSMFGRKPVANLPFLVARSRELTQEIQSVETHLENLRTDLRSVEATADSAGLLADLRAALAPPKEPEPIPQTRVRALKAYKVIFNGRYGPEEYSGAPTSVNDVPTQLLGRLKGRVQVVPPDTELRSRPLQEWMPTDGDD